MKHPWALRRIAVNKTQMDIADLLNVSRQTVIRLEQSLFHTVTVDNLNRLSLVFNSDPSELMSEYRSYITETRSEFRGRFPSFKEVLGSGGKGYTGSHHPLVYYREFNHLSRMQLCKGLCLDYGPVSEYEANRQRGLPVIIKLAAQEIYWDYAPLESAVSEWRSDGRADADTKRNGGANLFSGV
jgi:transcriptional regulator with XRE-family HTH domain